MKKIILIFVVLIGLFGCASKENETHQSGLVVSEAVPNKISALTKQNLLHLAQVYDLSPFLFTKRIVIQSKVVPHSYPVLMLNTTHAEQPNKLLANFLHEEIHWWLMANKQKANLAVLDLKKVYPKVPFTKVNGPYSTYLHLIVCYVELKALSSYIGKTEARKIITAAMKREKKYAWVYYQVLHRDFAIKKIVEKHRLSPIH